MKLSAKRWMRAKRLLGLIGLLGAFILSTSLFAKSPAATAAQEPPTATPPLPTAAPTSTPTPWPGASGKIVFVHREKRSPGISEIKIATINADGSNLVLLDDGDLGFPIAPAWSPDGTKIAYELFFGSAITGGLHIRVMNADGTGHMLLIEHVNNTYNRHPTWSPDDTQIAFAGHVGISVMEADGANRTVIGPPGDAPDWSPDGSRILFLGWEDLVPGQLSGPRDIFTIRPDGTDLVQVTQGGALNPNSNPAWSPDSSQIAYVNNGAIHVINTDASNHREVATPPCPGPPTWSPEGTELAVAAGDCGTSVNNLYVVSLVTGEVGHVPSIDRTANPHDPDWTAAVEATVPAATPSPPPAATLNPPAAITQLPAAGATASEAGSPWSPLPVLAVLLGAASLYGAVRLTRRTRCSQSASSPAPPSASTRTPVAGALTGEATVLLDEIR